MANASATARISTFTECPENTTVEREIHNELKCISKSIRDLKMSQNKFQLSVQMEIKNIKEAVNIVIDDKLSKFSTGFNMEMSGLMEKMDMLARRLSKLERDSEERQDGFPVSTCRRCRD